MANRIVNVVWHGTQNQIRQAAAGNSADINVTARQGENMNDVLLRIIARLPRGDYIAELNFWALDMFRVMVQGPRAFPETLTMLARQCVRSGDRMLGFYRCDGLTDRQAVLQLVTPLAAFFRPVEITVADSQGNTIVEQRFQ